MTTTDARIEALRLGLHTAEEYLRPELCEEVDICRHPACNAWIAAGLALANDGAPAPSAPLTEEDTP